MGQLSHVPREKTRNRGVHYLVAKGSKMAAITADGERIFIVPSTEPLRMPFGPGNYDKTPAVRQTLDLRCNSATLEYFTAMDAWLKDYLMGNSERIFKKQLSAVEIETGYHSCVTTRGSYEPMFRTKINLHEKGVTFWDVTGHIRGPPDDWRDLTAIPRLHVSHLWIMGREFGIVVNCVDLQVFEPVCRPCPFLTRTRSFVEPEADPPH
jgi:hypothetical protein